MWAIFSVWIIVTTILSNIVFKNEGACDDSGCEPDAQGRVLDINSTWRIFKLMMKTLMTKHWLMFLGICWLQRLGNGFFEGTLGLKILENPHIDKATFAGVDI
jgi:hypothetical protein